MIISTKLKEKCSECNQHFYKTKRGKGKVKIACNNGHTKEGIEEKESWEDGD
jgi:hypothetical protein